MVVTPRINTKLRPPRKGKRGIFTLFTAEAEGDQLAAILPSAKPSSQDAPCAPSSTVLPALVPATPRLDAVASLEESHPLKKPGSARTVARQDTRAKQDEEIVHARRALRTLWPGDWDPNVYRELRRRHADRGQWAVVNALSELVVKTSRDALDARSYRLSPKVEVRLPHRMQDSWFAFQSFDGCPTDATFVPPLIFAATGPLEVLSALKANHSSNPVVMSFDLTDFSPAGDVVTMDARSVAQRDIMVRTNLEQHIQQAMTVCKGGHTPPKEHLQAATDPYIIVANNVRVFRGPVEQGYPFLSEQDSAHVTMLLAGRHASRPEISKKGEYFVREKDVIATMDRLHLFALAAAAATANHVGRPGTSGAGPRGGPILILSMHDLTVAAAQQPRNSIAAAVRSWRKLYAHLFETVLVACGDAKTAEVLDGTVNGDLYASVLNSTWKPGPWHWDTSYLDLAANGMLTRLGQAVQAGRIHSRQSAAGAFLGTAVSADSGPSNTLPGSKGRRRSSVGLALSTRTEVIQEMGRDMQNSAAAKGQPATVWGKAQMERRQSLSDRRASLGGAPVEHLAPDGPVPPTGPSSPSESGRRHSSVAALDSPSGEAGSRSAWERAYQQRMADSSAHEPTRLQFYQHVDDEHQANTGVARTVAVSAFTKLAKDPLAVARQSRLEKQSQVERKANLLGMSADMKQNLSKQALQAMAKKPDAEADGLQKALEETETMVEDDIEKLASSFQRSQEVRLRGIAPAPGNGQQQQDDLLSAQQRRRGIPVEALAEKEQPRPPTPEEAKPESRKPPPPKVPLGKQLMQAKKSST